MFDQRPRYDPARIAELSAALRQQAADIAAAEYRWLRLLAEFDRLEGWGHEGCKTCAHWLSWACGIGPEAARERVRVARALEGLPLVCEAFAAGELSYSKVRAITRIATPQTEGQLVDWARWSTAAQMEKIVRGYRRAQRIEDAQKAQGSYQRRELNWYRDEDGSVVIHARLPAEEGALVIEAIQSIAQAAEPPQEPTAEPAPGPAAGLGPSRFPPLGELPELVAFSADVHNLWPARRADALRLMAEAVLANKPAVRNGGEGHEVIVHVDAATLADPLEGERCHLDDGTPLAVDTVRRIACDSSVRLMTHGPDGSVLDLGRRSRAPTIRLRRALWDRDGGCRFPSCTARAWCHAHHVHHWADGGETTLANLVLLCPFHHRLVHEGGYTIETDPSGGLVFRRPDGSTIREHHPPIRGEADRIGQTNRTLGIEVTAETPVAGAYVARPDFGVAVWGLLNRRAPEPEDVST